MESYWNHTGIVLEQYSGGVILESYWKSIVVESYWNRTGIVLE